MDTCPVCNNQRRNLGIGYRRLMHCDFCEINSNEPCPEGTHEALFCPSCNLLRSISSSNKFDKLRCPGCDTLIAKSEWRRETAYIFSKMKGSKELLKKIFLQIAHIQKGILESTVTNFNQIALEISDAAKSVVATPDTKALTFRIQSDIAGVDFYLETFFLPATSRHSGKIGLKIR